MTIRKILTFPESILNSNSDPVDEVDDEIKTLVRDMAETMYAAPGIGLAAPQVGVSKRVIVIDLQDREAGDNLIALVNPVIAEKKGIQVWEEGCLSVPGINEDVERAAWVRVKGLNQHGESTEIEGEGLLAVALQHEIDHLDGILFIDHLSVLKRNLIKKRIKSGKTAPRDGTPSKAI